MPYNRDEIRAAIFKKLGTKVKKQVLDKHIEGLIDEHIENQEFIKKHGLSLEDNPTKEQMKWWFQDRFDETKFVIEHGTSADVPLEIQTDDICLKDTIASEVFKTFYKFRWKQGEALPPTIKQLIKLAQLAEVTKNIKNKNKIKYRLNNIAVVGVIRFYHLERTPYLTSTQIGKAINFFINALLLISKIESGEYKDEEIKGELVLFEAFKDTKKKK